MSHLSKHLQRHVSTFARSLMQTRCEHCVNDTNAVKTFLAVVLLANFNIFAADGVDLFAALFGLRLQIVGFHQVLVILGNERVITAETRRDLSLGFEE